MTNGFSWTLNHQVKENDMDHIENDDDVELWDRLLLLLSALAFFILLLRLL